MQYIAHRINTVEELKKLPEEFGVELDLRDRGERLILQHDPFKDGEDFENYLPHFRHKTMILNIKSERVECKALELLRRHNIKDYFFLDSSFGMIYLLSQEGETNIAMRFSEFEGMETVLTMKGKAKWVWVDSFTRLPLDKNNFSLFKKAGFKICLVSPELVGRPEDILPYRQQLASEGIQVDAICTKSYHVEKWRGF